MNNDYNKYLTETDNGLDIEANNINANCITSQNNKFSLDSEGNMIVNSITTTVPIGGTTDKDEIFDMIYPVGSFYISASDTNPEILFKGTWKKISDKFLIGAGNSYKLGSTGGTKEHNHTLSNKGYSKFVGYNDGHLAWYELSGVPSWTTSYSLTSNGNKGETLKDNSTWGVSLGGNTDNTQLLPPYLAVNIWQRTA